MAIYRKTKSARIITNLLVALAISLVVNFSYLMLLMVDQSGDSKREEPKPLIEKVGILHLNPDGHAYLLAQGREGVDSLYVTQRRVSWWNLADRDTLRVKAEFHKENRLRVTELLERNGEPFDEAALFHRPSQGLLVAVQILFYLALSFVLVTLQTVGGERRGYSLAFYAKRVVIALLVAVAFYMVAPVQRWRTGELVLNFANETGIDYLVLLRVTFTVVVSLLYGYLYGLLHKSQLIALENEHLKNENLTSRYNMLVNQVNPHFFFNSLNSLAMLVREGQTEASLTYIDRLSYAFRYILQNGQTPLVKLEDELNFADAYSYLFKTRYADKLFFDIEIEPSKREYLLPALTLQPLMGNAVKHNTITTRQPLHVSIRTEGDCLIIENPVRPKLDPEPGVGIGLENLKNRWELITGHPIEIVHTEERFTVRLPLQNPAKR